MNLRKTSQGNYAGWYKGYYLFIFRRPHGKWCCMIRQMVRSHVLVLVASEGYFGTYLRTLNMAKAWAKDKIANKSLNKDDNLV